MAERISKTRTKVKTDSSTKSDLGNVDEMSYGVPVAIIIAGLIIAGSIMYTSGSSREVRIPDSGQVQMPQSYQALAESIGIDGGDFSTCMDERRYDARIDKDLENAIKTGGSGTPWSLVVTKNGTILPLSGAQAYPVVQEILALAIESQGSGTREAPEDDSLFNVRPVDESDHILGDLDAPISVIEYSDFECPYCRSFHPTMKRVVNEYEGQINWVYRHFPLETIHSTARNRAHASECVAELGGNNSFWEYTDLLFTL